MFKKGNILKRTDDTTNVKPYDANARYIVLEDEDVTKYVNGVWVNKISNDNNKWFSEMSGILIMYNDNGAIKKTEILSSINLPHDKIKIKSKIIKRSQVVGFYMKNYILEIDKNYLRKQKFNRILK